MRTFSTTVLVVVCATLLLEGLFGIARRSASAATDATIAATATISVCGNGTKEGGEQCDGSDNGTAQCSDLGFDGGTLGCDVSCSYDASLCTSVAEETATPIFTSTIGGSYTITDGADSLEITLPADFYTDDLRLQMFAFAPSAVASSEPAPSGESFVGKVYEIRAVDTDGGGVSTLSRAVTVTLTYADADTVGLDVGTLAPYRRETDDTAWHPISVYSVDAANRTVSFETDSFSRFTIFGSAPGSVPTTVPAVGGGGGGGAAVAPPRTGAAFTGTASPSSAVVLLKDAQVVARAATGADGAFGFSLSGLTPGSYLFSLYAEDADGTRSPSIAFPVTVIDGAVAEVGNVLLAPTLRADKTEVRRGETVRLFGRTAPNADVTITMDASDGSVAHARTGADGAYSYDLDTSSLAFGDHAVLSRTSLADGVVSGDSRTVSFTVGDRTVMAPTSPVALRGDFTGDGRVDIADFSVAAYWYGRADPPARVDLNGDGRVDLVDFSILVFFWTG